MADFNEIKSSVFSAIGNVADKTRKFAGKAADKAKDVSRITKLNFEIKSANDAIEKAYAEIGKLYYETHKNDPDSFFIQLCEEINSYLENIEEMRAELEDLKLGLKCDDDSEIEVEVTEVKSEEATASEVSEADFAKPEDNPEDGGGCSGN